MSIEMAFRFHNGTTSAWTDALPVEAFDLDYDSDLTVQVDGERSKREPYGDYHQWVMVAEDVYTYITQDLDSGDTGFLLRDTRRFSERFGFGVIGDIVVEDAERLRSGSYVLLVDTVNVRPWTGEPGVDGLAGQVWESAHNRELVGYPPVENTSKYFSV